MDANRNFDFHWGEEEVVNMEQDESYPGPSAFSESEARALRDVVYKYADQIKLYLTVHSYGGNILYPWGYTKTMPKDFDELDTLAKAAAAAITSVSGTRYEVGSPGKLLYIVSGATNDWVKAIGKVELSYAIELPGGGMNGFDLPLFEIENVCLETLEGLKVFHNHVVDKFK